MDKDILLAVYFGSQPPEYATDRELQRAKDYLNADLAAEAGPDLPGVSDLIHGYSLFVVGGLGVR